MWVSWEPRNAYIIFVEIMNEIQGDVKKNQRKRVVRMGGRRNWLKTETSAGFWYQHCRSVRTVHKIQFLRIYIS
jgi:hypothetical protein